MPKNKDALVRYRLINRCLIDYRYVTMEQLRAVCLETFDYEVGTRTIEKDIWAGSVSGDVVLVTTDFSTDMVWTEDWSSTDFQCPLCSSSDETEAGAGTGLYPTSSNEIVNPVLSTHNHYPC